MLQFVIDDIIENYATARRTFYYQHKKVIKKTKRTARSHRLRMTHTKGKA